MATGTTPKNSVWAAMSYTPPRGRCNHKSSLMSPACPCLRFMLHPVKAASSFDCDGCGHHASFHSLENPAEDAVLKKWSEQEAEAKEQRAVAGASKKRKLLTAKVDAAAGGSVVAIEDDSETDRNAVYAANKFKGPIFRSGQRRPKQPVLGAFPD